MPQGTPAQLGWYSEGAVKMLEGNISAVSLGSGIANAACVIMADTRVQCWGGTGSHGQLGRGDTLTREEQVFKPAYVLDEGGQMGDVVAIASGNGQHCVLKSDHSVHCWGSNASGSLADGTAIDRSVAVPSVVLPPDAVSSGERVVQLGLDISKGYAVTDANTLYEWGGTYTFSRDSDEKKQAALTSNKPRLSRASGGNNRGNTIAVLVENQGLCPVRTDFTLGCLPVGSYPPLVQPVPAPPNMAPVTVSENSATVTASASSEGATPTSIVVTATPGDPSPTCTINVAEGHTTCTVSPLTPGTAYTFEAIARNAQGDSGPSAAQTVTTGAVMKPAQPTVVVGDEELTVTPQPSDGGGTPTGYIVSVQPGGLTCEVIRPELSCTIGNLTNGTDYTVTMSAFNEANVSNASDPVNIVVGLPATPQEPTITVGDGRATVTISPSPTISANTAAGSPSYFTVTAAPGGGTCTVTPPDTACDVTGLTNGVEYTFTTTATNGWGTTSASTPVIELVDVKPNPPTQPTVVVAVGGVTVSSLPAGTGGSTQTITVSATPIGVGAALTCTITPPATDCFIPLGSDDEGGLFTFTSVAGNELHTSDPTTSAARYAKPSPSRIIDFSLGEPAHGTVILTVVVEDTRAGGPVDFFTVFANGAVPCVVAPPATSCSITLAYPADYVVTTSATNGLGEVSSNRGVLVRLTPPGDLLPPSVTSLATTSATVGNATVSVSPSAEDSTAFGFTISAVGPNGDSFSCVVDMLTLECGLANLQLGTEYSVTISAYNIFGATISAEATRMFLGPPGEPPVPVVTPGNGQVTVTVEPGLTGGTPTSYVVVATDADGVEVARCTVTPPRNGCALAPLTNGSAYSVSVSASNVFGASLASATASVIPKAPSLVVPPPPTTTTAADEEPTNAIVPTKPIPVRGSTDRLPRLAPGRTTVVTGDVSTRVTVAIETQTDLVIRNADFELRLVAQCASACPVSIDQSGRQVLELQVDGTVRVSGRGFMVGTSVYLWMFSQPRLLGELVVGDDGTFSGTLPIGALAPGSHTMQVNGLSLDGTVRTVNLGVVVVELESDGEPVIAPQPDAVPAPDGDSRLPATGTDVTGRGAPTLLLAMTLIGLGMLLIAQPARLKPRRLGVRAR